MLEVRELGPEIKPRCIESSREYRVTSDFVAKWLRPSWALVYHQLQGRTMERTMELEDLNHPRLTTTHLLVALSRARTKNIWLA